MTLGAGELAIGERRPLSTLGFFSCVGRGAKGGSDSLGVVGGSATRGLNFGSCRAISSDSCFGGSDGSDFSSSSTVWHLPSSASLSIAARSRFAMLSCRDTAKMSCACPTQPELDELVPVDGGSSESPVPSVKVVAFFTCEETLLSLSLLFFDRRDDGGGPGWDGRMALWLCLCAGARRAAVDGSEPGRLGSADGGLLRARWVIRISDPDSAVPLSDEDAARRIGGRLRVGGRGLVLGSSFGPVYSWARTSEGRRTAAAVCPGEGTTASDEDSISGSSKETDVPRRVMRLLSLTSSGDEDSSDGAEKISFTARSRMGWLGSAR